MNKGRRRFLIATGALAGGLAVGSWWFYRKRDVLTAPDSLTASAGETLMNAWIKIHSDGTIIVEVPRQEMGQGITTSLPMLVAEELNVDLHQVTFEQAPIATVYGNATMIGEAVPYRPDDDSWLADLTRVSQFQMGRILGLQGTGGSSSIRDAWEPMRRAGAAARMMLVAAAAENFDVPVDECTVAAGVVTHQASGASASFGELANLAGARELPSEIQLKPRAEFTLLGNSQARLDVPEKTNGGAEFAMDVRPAGMVYAAIRQCPILGGNVGDFDDAEAKAMPGVKAVMTLDATSTSAAAVAVVAEHYWQAKRALDALDIEWQTGADANFETSEQRARYEALLESERGRSYDAAGDIEAAQQTASQSLEAVYFAPYLAHAAMEPMNCTTVIRDDGSAEVWNGNQGPPLVRLITARAADIDADNITVHTPYLGGGFGRRAEMDVVMQAAMIANEIRGTPVQLIWSREEDIQHDIYRPLGLAKLRASFDGAQKLSGFDAKLVGQSPTYSIVSRLLPGMQSTLMKDRTTAEGIFDLPYAIDHRRVTQVFTDEPVQVGYWRSVGHSHHAFFAEAFIDECAEAANRDPVAFRLEMLNDKPRHRAVLDLAAAKAGWANTVADGIGRGVALAESFGSIVAQVAEVEIDDGEIAVRRVVCAIDCGFAVNPDTVIAQMESGIIYGLTAALYGEITFENGRVLQSNFPDYRMITLANAPEIEVHIIESGIEHLGGVGEPGTPPIAPAVANAIYRLTGKRVRELPIKI